MSKDIRDFLHYYIGHVDYRVKYIDGNLWTVWSNLTPGRYAWAVEDHSVEKIEIGVRKLESMSEDEMKGLLISMTPPDMEDAPDAEDYSLEMFYNDGGNDVDGDVAVGANCASICWEGQLAVRYNGDIDLFDEEGNRNRVVNQVAAFHYLLSRGFDLFGLINAGLAIDKATIKS